MMYHVPLPAPPPPATPLPLPARPGTESVAPAERIAVEGPGTTATDQVNITLKKNTLLYQGRNL